MTIGVNCLILLTAEVEDDLAEAIFFNRYTNTHEVAGTDYGLYLLI